jgi:hypothetical protein
MGMTEIKNNSNITYCLKDGKKIDLTKDNYVVDINENIFCDEDCRREFWLEIRQDYDDVIREIYGQDC